MYSVMQQPWLEHLFGGGAITPAPQTKSVGGMTRNPRRG
jgi:hypothetical protein